MWPGVWGFEVFWTHTPDLCSCFLSQCDLCILSSSISVLLPLFSLYLPFILPRYESYADWMELDHKLAVAPLYNAMNPFLSGPQWKFSENKAFLPCKINLIKNRELYLATFWSLGMILIMEVLLMKVLRNMVFLLYIYMYIAMWSSNALKLTRNIIKKRFYFSQWGWQLIANF